MSVGILTWYDVLNYGSAFQAYALQQAIESIGEHAEILRHDRVLPDYFGNRLTSYTPRAFVNWLRVQTPSCRYYRKATRAKFEAFQSFYKEYLDVGPHFSATMTEKVIIGSDQIFDISAFYYPFQFGAGVPCAQINAYAPCFGETTWDTLKDSAHFEEICDNLRKMRIVTARDANTQEVLKRILDKPVPLVLDPTLLYDFKREKRDWNQRICTEKYCVVYTWGGYTTTQEFAMQCRAFAQRNGLKLVSVGEPRKWCDLQYSSASPIEFFELFMHADMVLTNMFHGTCFALLHNRPFYSFTMPHNYNKLAGLLKDLHLTEHIMYAPEDISELNIPEMNNDGINKILFEKRQKSMEQLLQIISA